MTLTFQQNQIISCESTKLLSVKFWYDSIWFEKNWSNHARAYLLFVVKEFNKTTVALVNLLSYHFSGNGILLHFRTSVPTL